MYWTIHAPLINWILHVKKTREMRPSFLRKLWITNFRMLVQFFIILTSQIVQICLKIIFLALFSSFVALKRRCLWIPVAIFSKRPFTSFFLHTGFNWWEACNGLMLCHYLPFFNFALKNARIPAYLVKFKSNKCNDFYITNHE